MSKNKIVSVVMPNYNVPEDYLKTSNLEDEVEQVKFIPSQMSLEELSKIWSIFFQQSYALSMAYQASEQSEVSSALFASVADCESGIAFQEVILEAKAQPDLSNGYIIESFVCSINPGKDMGDVRKAIKTWHAYSTKVGSPGPVIMRTLQVGNFPFDLSYFVVHQDLTAYAANTTKYLTGKGIESTQAALDKVQSCTGTLWRGQQMTP